MRFIASGVSKQSHIWERLHSLSRTSHQKVNLSKVTLNVCWIIAASQQDWLENINIRIRRYLTKRLGNIQCLSVRQLKTEVVNVLTRAPIE